MLIGGCTIYTAFTLGGGPASSKRQVSVSGIDKLVSLLDYRRKAAASEFILMNIPLQNYCNHESPMIDSPHSRNVSPDSRVVSN
jgi:hypothetical protein